MDFTTHKYIDVQADVERLCLAGYKEVDNYPGNPKPNLDHAEFIHLDNLGMLQVVIAEDENGIHGFHISMVKYDIFYKDVLTSYVLFYYLLPEYRGNGNGTKLFEYAEELFDEQKVKRSFLSRKIYIPNENVLTKLDYTHIEAGYSKNRK